MSRPRSITYLVFLLLTALLASNGYVWLTNHVRFSDEHSYLLLAQGRIGEVSTFHRYRVVVPLLAGALAWPVIGLVPLLQTTQATANRPALMPLATALPG